MDNDVERRQELRLIKAFLSITDARKRQRIISLAERLADDTASDTTAPDVATAPSAEESSNLPRHIE